MAGPELLFKPLNENLASSSDAPYDNGAHAAAGSQTLQFLAANGGQPPTPPDVAAGFNPAAMRGYIEQNIGHSLGQMLEFQRFGKNRLLPDVADIDKVKSRLRAMKWRPLVRWQREAVRGLETSATAFLDRFKAYRSEKGLQGTDLDLLRFKMRLLAEGDDQEATDAMMISQANLLVGHIDDTLELLQSFSFYPEEPSWDKFLEREQFRLLDRVFPMTQANQAPVDLFNTHLTGQFEHLLNSVTWEQRRKREELGGRARLNVSKLLSGVNLRARFAKEARTSFKGVGLPAYIADVCEVLPDILRTIKRKATALNPSLTDPAEPASTAKGRFGRARDTSARGNSMPLRRDIVPEAFKSQTGMKRLALVAGDMFKGAQDFVATTSSKAVKRAHRAKGARHAPTDGNTVVLQAGLTLLDTLQQTMANVSKAHRALQPLRDAVELGHILADEASRAVHPALAARLQGESDRWQSVATQEQAKLEDRLQQLMPLAQAGSADAYLLQLRELLAEAPPAMRNTVDRFDRRIQKIVAGLAATQGDLCITALRLGKLGMTQRAQFHNAWKLWPEELAALKNAVKASLAEATGQSIDNFSRHGMLSRGMAQLSQANKQRYLADVPEAAREEAGIVYDRLFLQVMEDHLPLFAKESDPRGRRFLTRLRQELGHASRDATLYPATMAEILAGMKSTQEDLSAWSRRRLVSGVLLGAAMGTFSLAATGWRISSRVVFLGYDLYQASRAEEKGTRVGQTTGTGELGEYARRKGTRAAIKLVVSLPPGLATAYGMTSVVWDAYEGGLDAAVDKIAQDVLGEVALMPLYQPGHMAREALAEWVRQSRVEDQVAQLVRQSEQVGSQALEDEGQASISRGPRNRRALQGESRSSALSSSDDYLTLAQVLDRHRTNLGGLGFDLDAFEEAIESPPEAEVPATTWKSVGRIDRSAIDFPADKKFYMTWGNAAGEMSTEVVDIPADKRSNYVWQPYVAQVISKRTQLRRVVSAEEAIRIGDMQDGDIQPIDSSFRNVVYVAGGSDITAARWSFDAPASVPGLDLSFPELDEFKRNSLYQDILQVECTALGEEVAKGKAAVQEAAKLYGAGHALVIQLQRVLTPKLARLAVLNSTITSIKADIEGSRRQALAQRDFIMAMSTTAEPVPPSNYSALDRFTETSRHLNVLLQQEAAVNDYLFFLLDPDVAARDQLRIDTLHSKQTELERQVESATQSVEEHDKAAESDRVQKALDAVEAKRLESNRQRSDLERADFEKLAELSSEHNQIQAQLTDYAWSAQYAYTRWVDRSKPIELPPVVRGAPGTYTDLLSARQAAQDAVTAQRQEMERSRPSYETQPAAAAPAVAAEVTPTNPFQAPPSVKDKAAGHDKLDLWLIESARDKGLAITKADLDGTYRVKYSQMLPIPGQRSMESRETKDFTLRQILLGEADRERIMNINGGNRLTVDGSRADSIISFIDDADNRLDVSGGVKTAVNKAIDTHFKLPEVRRGFEMTARGIFHGALNKVLPLLSGQEAIHTDIAKQYELGNLTPTAVYFNGKVVPGLLAVGHGDYRIIVSLDTRKVIFFNAYKEMPGLSDFLRPHLAAADKNPSNDRLGQPVYKTLPRGFHTYPSSVTFGSRQQDAYATALQANADKLKSDFDGLIYTRDELNARLGEGAVKASLKVADMGIMLATMGASTAAQVATGTAAALGSSLTEMYLDKTTASTADRSEDREQALKDIEMGKWMWMLQLGMNLTVPLATRIRGAKNAGELAEAVGDVTAAARSANGLAEVVDNVSIGSGTGRLQPPASGAGSVAGPTDLVSGQGRGTLANGNFAGTTATEGWGSTRIPLGDPRDPGRGVRGSLGSKHIGHDSTLSKPRRDGSKNGPWPNERGTLEGDDPPVISGGTSTRSSSRSSGIGDVEGSTPRSRSGHSHGSENSSSSGFEDTNTRRTDPRRTPQRTEPDGVSLSDPELSISTEGSATRRAPAGGEMLQTANNIAQDRVLRKNMYEEATGSWDAVYEFEHRHGNLDATQLADLKTRTTARDPSAFIGSNRRKLDRIEDFATLQPGDRVGFFDSNGRMVHSMIALGDGKLGGINNNRLGRYSLGHDWMVIDPASDPFLRNGSGGMRGVGNPDRALTVYVNSTKSNSRSSGIGDVEGSTPRSRSGHSHGSENSSSSGFEDTDTRRTDPGRTPQRTEPDGVSLADSERSIRAGGSATRRAPAGGEMLQTANNIAQDRVLRKNMYEEATGSWDAVYEFEHRHGNLDATQLADLKTRTTARDPSAFIGSNRRKLDRIEDFATLQPGDRVGFFDSNGRMVHSMIALGDGKLGGINNNRLGRYSLGHDWMVIDPASDPFLRNASGGMRGVGNPDRALTVYVNSSAGEATGGQLS